MRTSDRESLGKRERPLLPVRVCADRQQRSESTSRPHPSPPPPSRLPFSLSEALSGSPESLSGPRLRVSLLTGSVQSGPRQGSLQPVCLRRGPLQPACSPPASCQRSVVFRRSVAANPSHPVPWLPPITPPPPFVSHGLPYLWARASRLRSSRGSAGPVPCPLCRPGPRPLPGPARSPARACRGWPTSSNPAAAFPGPTPIRRAVPSPPLARRRTYRRRAVGMEAATVKEVTAVTAVTAVFAATVLKITAVTAEGRKRAAAARPKKPEPSSMVCLCVWYCVPKFPRFGRYFSSNYRIFPTLPYFSDSYRIFPTATEFYRQASIFSDKKCSIRHIPTILPPNRCVLFRYIPSPFPDPPIPSSHPRSRHPILPARPRRAPPPAACHLHETTKIYRQSPNFADSYRILPK